MMSRITLRPVTAIEEVEYFQELERQIWQSPPEETVAVHVAITVLHNGGGLIAAFDNDGPPETGGMVGLTFWFPGLGVPTTSAVGRTHSSNLPAAWGQPAADHRTALLKMCSHMAGVLPAYQGYGIGVQLKLAQREAILAQGMTDWVTWTYDPLFRTNAVLNIRRLGAICNTYKPNWYGELKDGLNAGVPSDRCQVDWWLDSERVRARSVNAERRHKAVDVLPPNLQILPTRPSGAGFRAPVDDERTLDGCPVAAPIPDDIVAIRRKDAGLGMAWRLSMRHTLEGAFAAGYVMTDCLYIADAGWHYLLEHPSVPSLERHQA